MHCQQAHAASSSSLHICQQEQTRPADGARSASCEVSGKSLDVMWRRLPRALAGVGSTNDLFWSLYGQQDAHDTFWLDRCLSLEAALAQDQVM